ncbi:hypothetical protein A0H81_14815 [Grifola frondosa]|uniref:Uncharacterized protein n=1 Tax=Grifola frondosa TaxID=5627 RepID=A0A1C7LMH3_GRIFR|nr:hypothetical protein A0H81_14815 [Grifola frondosa]
MVLHYVVGMVGKWGALCLNCKQWHYPPQPQPTAAQIATVEAQRAADLREEEMHKDQKLAERLQHQLDRQALAAEKKELRLTDKVQKNRERMLECKRLLEESVSMIACTSRLDPRRRRSSSEDNSGKDEEKRRANKQPGVKASKQDDDLQEMRIVIWYENFQDPYVWNGRVSRRGFTVKTAIGVEETARLEALGITSTVLLQQWTDANDLCSWKDGIRTVTYVPGDPKSNSMTDVLMIGMSLVRLLLAAVIHFDAPYQAMSRVVSDWLDASVSDTSDGLDISVSDTSHAEQVVHMEVRERHDDCIGPGTSARSPIIPLAAGPIYNPTTIPVSLTHGASASLLRPHRMLCILHSLHCKCQTKMDASILHRGRDRRQDDRS